MAHALLVREQPDDTVTTESVNETYAHALLMAERVSTLCAAREALRYMVASADDPDACPLESNVLVWAHSRASSKQSESALKAHADAIAADWLDPSMLPCDEARTAVSAVATRTPVAALLTMQHAEAATCAAQVRVYAHRCSNGFAL